MKIKKIEARAARSKPGGENRNALKNNPMTIIGLINMQEKKAHNIKLNPLLEELEGWVSAMTPIRFFHLGFPNPGHEEIKFA